MIAATLIAALVVAEPCATATVMRAGQVAACDGALVPVDDVRWAIETEGEARACKVEFDGLRRQCEIDREAHAAEIAVYEQMLDDVRAPGFDWTALIVGASIGLVAGGAIVFALTKE